MTVFFTCIILIGSGLVVFALILMLSEKRRIHDWRDDVKQKKEDLIKVIEDAETLIDEMNRFSDYVVSNLEQSNTALQKTIQEADYRIELLNSKNLDINNVGHSEPEVRPIEEPIDEQENQEETIPLPNPEIFRKGKVIPFDVKRREIIKLSRSGLDSTQIARLLNIGKGEIELIARMSREA
jgi:DNA-binding NarL/FixJ family response regulator